MSRSRGEAGQALPLVIVVSTVLTVLLVGALVGLGVEARLRGRAQAVADLVALAAVAHPDDGSAELVARRNGAELTWRTWDPDGAVTVVIDLGGRRAVAAAAR